MCGEIYNLKQFYMPYAAACADVKSRCFQLKKVRLCALFVCTLFRHVNCGAVWRHVSGGAPIARVVAALVAGSITEALPRRILRLKISAPHTLRRRFTAVPLHFRRIIIYAALFYPVTGASRGGISSPVLEQKTFRRRIPCRGNCGIFSYLPLSATSRAAIFPSCESI